MERGVIFSALVPDGDNKTRDILEKANLYRELDGSPSIVRFECIAHVAKRMKANLFKRQEKLLKIPGADKAAKTRSLEKNGYSAPEIKKLLDKE